MYETLRIVNKLKPKYVIWENVKNILSKKHKHNFDRYVDIMNEGGYTSYYQVLDAKDYGIPQHRERVFVISIKRFEYPEKEELKLRLKDMLEDNVDEKYYLSLKMMNYVLDYNETQKNTAWEGRADNDTINSNIAHTIGVRSASGNQRAGVSNFICDNIKNEIKAKDIKLRIKNNTKQGYDIATIGDSVNLQQPNSETRRGRVGHEVSQTLQTTGTMGVVTIGNYTPSNQEKIIEINKNAKHQQDLVQSEDDICRTIPAGTHGSTPHLLKTIVSDNRLQNDGLRIRKLTPKECWRLMGFKDEEFEKAEKVNSNTQLYKQAGNSIVVNVLEKILKNLIGEKNAENNNTIALQK